ncbi:MAG: GNAT family N-acetyltransferase [Pseudomonadota bacterium]
MSATGKSFRIRSLQPEDMRAVLAMNAASTPAVGELEAVDLDQLVDVADLARVAVRADAVLGTVVALLPGRAYDSPNYRWFDNSGVAFLYVDRVIVAGEARGTGVGRALYDDVVRAARAMGLPRVVCEVNEVPPNPSSLAFHEAMGFEGLRSMQDPRNGKVVRMMELSLG